MNTKSVLAQDIKKKLLENWVDYVKLFLPHQSDFLCGLYKRYQCLDNGSLVIYFAKNTHQAILRKKDYDLNYDLCFEKFWSNHSEVEVIPSTIINIAKDANLPKETTRRKLSELIKQKVLSKKNKYIFWMPNEEYKEYYNKFIGLEIRNIARLTKYVTDQLNIDTSVDKIDEEYKKKFSFYWFHYLDLQLKWMKMWKAKFHDLEIVLIMLQFLSLLSSKIGKDKTISHGEIFKKPDIIKNPPHQAVSVSATSVSDVTGIPRATCIRKLNQMVKLKLISQDKITKRYYVIPDSLTKNFLSKEMTEKVTEIFSEFYFISIKALNFKASH